MLSLKAPHGLMASQATAKHARMNDSPDDRPTNHRRRRMENERSSQEMQKCAPVQLAWPCSAWLQAVQCRRHAHQLSWHGPAWTAQTQSYPEGPQLWRGPLRKVLSATLLPEPVHPGSRQTAKRQHLRHLPRDDPVDSHRPTARTIEQPWCRKPRSPRAHCHTHRCKGPAHVVSSLRHIAPAAIARLLPHIHQNATLPHQCGRSLRAAAAPQCTAHAAATDAAAYSRCQTSLCAHNRLTTADHAASRAARSPSSAQRARAPPPPPRGRCLRRARATTEASLVKVHINMMSPCYACYMAISSQQQP
jgi:hypothetical protein